MINSLIHIVALLLLPPLLFGVIAKTKALFAGRAGPSLLQPYYDLVKLAQREAVLSTTATWIFSISPVIILVATFMAGLLVPIGGAPAPISFSGDVILFAYLFGLSRFFIVAAALDTGSAFEGMGAAREASFACLAEPALFFGLLMLAKRAGSLSLSTMLHPPDELAAAGGVAPLVLVGIGLFIVLLAETCRIPVDDPTTHLELTMIHEAMVLDHSGPLFGILLYASSMKLLVLGSLLLHAVVPFGHGQLRLTWCSAIAWLIGLAMAIGVIESVMARLRMSYVPRLLLGALLFCGFGFILLVR